MSNLCYSCMQEKLKDQSVCPHCGYENGQNQGEHYYLPEGTKLNDRYIVGRVLGHGGFGITYIGLDTKFDTKVAVKEYLPSDISTRALGETTVSTFSGEKYDAYVYGLGRFIDEAKTLAKYNSHQCIVSINDYFEQNNTAYIVMEYLDGISLSEYIKRSGGKISLDETLEIMRPVMDALKEVHANGMIHRDVSPDNIFITKNKQVKLLDFGAARHAMSEKSKSLSVVLKPGYAPPEQYYTKGKQGPWTDVYAVSATMYKCVTGATPPESMERVVNDSIVYPPSMPNDFVMVLQNALNVNVDERYQSMETIFSNVYSKRFTLDTPSNSYAKNTGDSLSVEEELEQTRREIAQRKHQEELKIQQRKKEEEKKRQEERIKQLTPKYKKAMEHFAEGRYGKAYEKFEKLGDFKNSKEFLNKAKAEIERMKKEKQEQENSRRYHFAKTFIKEQKYKRAESIFIELGNYKDSKNLLMQAREGIKKLEEQKKEESYNLAKDYLNEKKYVSAIKLFRELGNYKESVKLKEEAVEGIKETNYLDAVNYFNNKKYKNALEIFRQLEKNNYKDSTEYIDKINKRGVKIFYTVTATIVSVLVLFLVTAMLIIPNAKYNKAAKLRENGQYEEAIVSFEELDGFRDSDEQVKETYYQYGISLQQTGNYILSADKLSQVFTYKDASKQISESFYQFAIELREKGNYDIAIDEFESIIDYKDSEIQILEIKYQQAVSMMENEDFDSAIEIFTEIIEYKDSETKIEEIQKTYELIYRQAMESLRSNKINDTVKGLIGLDGYRNSDEILAQYYYNTISAGFLHTACILQDGTVMTCGINEDGQCGTEMWSDIISVSAGDYHTVGLKSDGTVVSAGSNFDDECNTEKWLDIVSVSAGNQHTVGLKSDGTVVAVGANHNGQCNTEMWSDIVSVIAGNQHTVGLKSDGTVAALGWNKYGQCNTDDWADIIALSAGNHHTVGLKSDGTVVAAGSNKDWENNNYLGQCDIGNWSNIIAVSAGDYHTVGLKSDGTVVALGWNKYGQCNTEGWRDIIAVSAGDYHTLGLKADGTIVCVGDNGFGQCDIENWTDIKMPMWVSIN